jgi:uncharacterized protein (TIGR02678 family)
VSEPDALDHRPDEEGASGPGGGTARWTSSVEERVAAGVPAIRLTAYQQLVRRLLRHPLLTFHTDGPELLGRVREWEDVLRADLDALLRYRLDLSPTCARLVKRPLESDARHPVRTGRGRPFDRQRYAYLCLLLAVVSGAGSQIVLSELAELLTRRAADIEGLGFDPDRYADRLALIDVVRWLEETGVMRVHEGTTTAWARDPDRDALYDIDHDVALRLFQPPAVLQSVEQADELLDEAYGSGREAQRRRVRQRLVRRLVETPAVLVADLAPDERDYLQREAASIALDVERLTGLPVERRAEGMALIDTSGTMSDLPFPANGTVAQVALLLCGELVARAGPPVRDAPAVDVAGDTAGEGGTRTTPGSLVRLDVALASLRARAASPGHGDARSSLAPGASLDPDSLPTEDDLGPGGLTTPTPTPTPTTTATAAAAVTDVRAFPTVGHHDIAMAVTELTERYGRAFKADYRDDPPRLLADAVDLLVRLDLVRPTRDGRYAVLPTAARYRAEVRYDDSHQLSLLS